MILWMCTHAGHAQPEPFQGEVMRVIYVVQEGSRWMVKHVLNAKLGSISQRRANLLVFLVDPAFQ